MTEVKEELPLEKKQKVTEEESSVYCLSILVNYDDYEVSDEFDCFVKIFHSKSKLVLYQQLFDWVGEFCKLDRDEPEHGFSFKIEQGHPQFDDEAFAESPEWVQHGDLRPRKEADITEDFEGQFLSAWKRAVKGEYKTEFAKYNITPIKLI